MKLPVYQSHTSDNLFNTAWLDIGFNLDTGKYEGLYWDSDEGDAVLTFELDTKEDVLDFLDDSEIEEAVLAFEEPNTGGK